MDDLTRRVCDMYTRYPYPAPQGRTRKLKELRNLLSIFTAEHRYDLAGKSVLDAGTGTGQRLVQAALAFKETRFLAVDLSETALDIAREAAEREGVSNVEFKTCNLMDDGATLGRFDVILSMGVVHHLADPAAGLRNLVRNLADDGIIFLYLYGRMGGRERLRRKAIVSLLLNGAGREFERGLRMVKDLGFATFEYGWNLDAEDEDSKNALLVDAYLNVNETQFDADGLMALMRGAGLAGFATYGLTCDQSGLLFDTRPLQDLRGAAASTTNVLAKLPTPELRESYRRLSIRDRYRLVDLLFQPNGYTVLGFREGARRHFAPDSRVLANAIDFTDF
jgi:SAM-dependent methyltransferase